METYDVVIVGAGVGGCVLAHRLSEDPTCRVLLLESGPPDNNPLIHMPKGLAKLRRDGRYMWNFDVFQRAGDTTPVRQWFRGRTLGGSSSINGMIYTRGQPSDYDDLAALTSDDWNWDRMLEAFKAIEDHGRGASASRGRGGPLKVTAFAHDCGSEEVMEALIKSSEAQGLQRREDVNDPDQGAKIGYSMRTIHKGRRQSAAVAFLRPAQRRANLVVRTGMLADRVLFEGTRAVGVECRDAHGGVVRFGGQRIVVSAGTLCSPAILQRSGIGHPDLLARHGIPVVSARPAVGENLIEHTSLTLMYRSRGPSNNRWYRGVGALLSGIRYLTMRTGPLAHAVFEVTGLYKIRPDADRPEGQLNFGPHSFLDFHKTTRRPDTQPGFMLLPFPLRPRSKGQVFIESRDPAVVPRIVYDPLADPQDRRELIAGVRLARRIVACSTAVPVRPGGDDARHRRADRRADPRRLRPPGRPRLPRRGHLPHGRRRRLGRGSADARARCREPERRRPFHLPDPDVGQHLRSRRGRGLARSGHDCRTAAARQVGRRFRSCGRPA